MVKLVGPCMSMEASGTLGGTITFATWKGRAYARQCVVPTNPKSASQTGMRVMFSFLSKQWSNISTADRSTFDAEAEAAQVSSFNIYMKKNMERWKNFIPPAQTSTAAEDSSGLTVTSMSLSGGEGHVGINLIPSGSTAIWGFIIFRSSSAIASCNNSNAIAVIEADGMDPVSFNDSGLEPGTYHYRAAVINEDGVKGTEIADDTATAT